MLERVYVEIGNICNLSCGFCVGTNRAKKQMNETDFSHICEKIKNHTKFIYLHVLGEPLIHPLLSKFLDIARESGIRVCITTNGTLLSKHSEMLLSHSDVIHKISISLHSLEGNGIESFKDYLKNASAFARDGAEKGMYIVFRLWNGDSSEKAGANNKNSLIEQFLKNEFKNEWQIRPQGFRLQENIFLHYDGIFTWPTESRAQAISEGYCHALSSQAAILVDGTVVPCCLDANGEIPLGNIFEESFDEILNSRRAREIIEGFKKGEMRESLCQKCTFARRFKKRNN